MIGRRMLMAGVATWFTVPAGCSAPLPGQVRPGQWQFFSAEEGAAVEVLVDRLIPPDPETAGGKDAGCAVFIDRQLAGPYGTSAALYMAPPFQDGLPTQGDQSPLTPATRYRQGLAALDAYVRAGFVGKSLHELSNEQVDGLLAQMERGSLAFERVSAKGFFSQLLKDTQHGFLADPMYGGNRDMCAWKMIGFPGARYDYRDWVERHNERYPLPPVSLRGRPEWSPRAG